MSEIEKGQWGLSFCVLEYPSFKLTYERNGYFDARPVICITLLWFELILKLPWLSKYSELASSPRWGVSIEDSSLWVYTGNNGYGGAKYKTWDLPFFHWKFLRWEIKGKSGWYLDTGKESDSTSSERDLFWIDYLSWGAETEIIEKCSKQQIYYYDWLDNTDGKLIPCKFRVERRTWHRKWLGWLPKQFSFAWRFREYIDVSFKEEVGSEKGSWKGGVTGIGFPILPNEDPMDCIERHHRTSKL